MRIKESRESSERPADRGEQASDTKSPPRCAELAEYCEAHSTSFAELCAEIDNYTQQNFALARMIIGSWQASFLQFLIMTTRAKRVLEIGTFTGYSALAMAEALPAAGEVITIDVNTATTELARSFWAKSAAGKKIKTLTKPALEALEELTGEFDLVFIDADKENVKSYCERALTLLSRHGIIAVDNAFMDGEVLHSKTASDSVRAMADFNAYIATREDLHKVLINIRDGVYLITKA